MFGQQCFSCFSCFADFFSYSFFFFLFNFLRNRFLSPPISCPWPEYIPLTQGGQEGGAVLQEAAQEYLRLLCDPGGPYARHCRLRHQGH